MDTARPKKLIVNEIFRVDHIMYKTVMDLKLKDYELIYSTLEGFAPSTPGSHPDDLSNSIGYAVQRNFKSK